MWKTKRTRIKEILAMPTSNEYNRLDLLRGLYSDISNSKYEEMEEIFYSSEKVYEITFEEFISVAHLGKFVRNRDAVEKLLRYPEWYSTDLNAWSRCVCLVGSDNFINLFPYELWDGRPFGLWDIVKSYSTYMYSSTYSVSYMLASFFSDVRNYQKHFHHALKWDKFGSYFSGAVFADDKFRALFGNDFENNTLERHFQLDLLYYGNKFEGFLSELSAFEMPRVVAFFNRCTLSADEVMMLADKKFDTFEQYVRMKVLGTDFFVSLKKKYPDAVYANDFSTVEAALDFCRDKGIVRALEVFSKLEGVYAEIGLCNLIQLLAMQINVHIAIYYWQKIVHLITPKVYIELKRCPDLLKDVENAGFVASDELLKQVSEFEKDQASSGGCDCGCCDCDCY